MKQFTSFFVLCFITAPFFHSCMYNIHKEIKGNYTIVNEKIEIDDYDEIVLDVSAEVLYRQISQEKPFLQISVDENILSSLDVSVKNNRLTITQNNDSSLKPSRFKIYTNSKNLSKVDIRGSGSICLEKEVNTRDMDIRIAGSGEVSADSLYCENITLKISGSGEAEIKGAATHAEFHIAGSGEIKAFDYFINNLDCSISGSGDVETLVYENLNVSVSGSGDLKYKGNPTHVTSKVSGSGDIREMER